ncbi:TonB-dependent receptor domain-containing protein [Marivirga atlantica]|jgi:outer membrane receptor protein involved in Fe transport|uniref:TonB-dependent receptor n=1 Tax=Marivirga atlantica TaxID=1548457 RepID=A0A937DKN6_9BACT|nr:TonB-dependent receptor [Marivirga atlantica]MBL0767120.1 TonB-dependent receptor [Marivirga atlantica]
MTKINQFIIIFLFLGPIGVFAQKSSISVSGTIKDKVSKETLPFVNVVLKKHTDSTFVSGTISNDNGLFTFSDAKPNDYLLEVSYIGYKKYSSPVFIGSNSEFIDLGTILLEEDFEQLNEVVVTAQQDAVTGTMDKKTYSVEDNVSQSGGSVLQSMQNLPGVTIQEGQVQLRGSDQVMVLIDGKQTAVTGFGNQNGLDNIPASAIQKIEIINNPSAKYDANGNAGIINIVMKKEVQQGFNGKVGLTTGLGALWIRKENLPTIRPQYRNTPKINPSIALNYRKKKINFFVQADNLYTETLNKNEFVTRTYNDGTVINQQMKRNRNTNFFSSKAGMDWFINDYNSLTVSGLFSQESIQDYGDQPFFNDGLNERLRLWQFLEDEVLTAAMASLSYQHKFQQPGHKLNIGFNYTFDREDEKYFFTNIRPSFTSKESFFLIADQTVTDFTVDYTKPLKHGFLETGFKFRRRTIPTNMQFNPSESNSVLDTGADGLATYKESIPAVYGNYIYEVKKLEAEIGLRVEYVDLQYNVDPNHNTYKSDGYNYFQPFPNARLTYKVNDRNKLSAFYNRRVDRPDEVDIRIFPKYDDAEIIKVGNPSLRPQFTNSFELGYKNDWNKGYFYGAAYHRISDGTITRVATTVDTTNLIYNISQNAGKSNNTGVEVVISQELSDKININLNLNGYYNQIDAFTVINQYPVENTFTAEQQEIYSGNIKLNTNFIFGKNIEAQLTAIYLSPDIIPQGTIDSRFSLDLGIKRGVQKGKGELFLNATDLLNTMVIQKKINGNNFSYTSKDYYETQVIRIGYNYKF